MLESFSETNVVCEDAELNRLVVEAKNCVAHQESLCLTTSEILYRLQSIRRHITQLTSLAWLPEREGVVEQPAELECLLKHPYIFSGITNLDIAFDVPSDWFSDRIFRTSCFSDVKALSCRLHPGEPPDYLAFQFQKTSLKGIKELEIIFPSNRVELSRLELMGIVRYFPFMKRLAFINFQMNDEEFRKIPIKGFPNSVLEEFVCLDTVKRRYQHWSGSEEESGVEIGDYPPTGNDKLSLL